jgi:predicted Zn-dependent peptidase
MKVTASRYSWVVLVAGLWVWSSQAAAADPAAVGKLTIPHETYLLPNGLRVILHVDRASPLVAVNIWYHVGSKDEAKGRTGFAHLFEHLMFTGSKNAPYPSFDSLMEAWGGSNNGSTTTDRTNYYEIGPSNLLETFLWLEADRMATLDDAISDDALNKQRLVVQNERRQSYENRPYGKVQLLMSELLYPPEHPYHWPTIGSHVDLEAAKLDDVRAFFRSFYVPSNASLVIAGDFEPKDARKLVERYFGWMPQQPVPARADARPVVLTADKRQDITDKVQLPRLDVAWHSPPSFAPGDAELDVAAQILGSGKASRLYRTLVYEKRLAQNVRVFQASARLGSRFSVSVTAKPQQSLDEISKVVDQELKRLCAEPPTAEEVERARNRILAGFYDELDTLAGRADLLNNYEYLLGDPGGLARDVDRYLTITPARVSQTLASVVSGKRVVVRTFPEKAAAPAQANKEGGKEAAKASKTPSKPEVK